MQKLLRLTSRIFKNVRTTLLVLLLALGVIAAIAYAVVHSGVSVPVLEPKGTIAREQKNLLLISTGLMLLVVVPVFLLTFGIAWKYRASNTKAKYRPDWDHNKRLELLWWGIPLAIIVVLASITWVTSHTLDPFRPLSSTQQPLKIQVVALQWKWLFIYPDSDIASVNEVALPVNRPVEFEITSDAPMNSFWIPSLAGQVYAMSGMSTKLHVVGDTIGDYRGSSANISGEGFAKMKFVAKVLSENDYEMWVANAQMGGEPMDWTQYNLVATPSWSGDGTKFMTGGADLYARIIQRYHASSNMETDTSENTMTDHDMTTMEGMHAH